MKRWLPYIIPGLLMVFLVLFVVTSQRKTPKNINENVTLKQKDKIPYGTAVARSLLPQLFPDTRLYQDNRKPADWDSILTTSYNQAVVLVSKNFNADEEELARLLHFARQGNFVFIIARSFSPQAVRLFNFSYNEHNFEELMTPQTDSLRLRLDKEVFGSHSLYIYPGKKYESNFFDLDTGHTVVLGRNEHNEPNFIALRTGNGGFFIHSAPLAFSNYFILHKNNSRYYEQAMSVIPQSVDRIVWNEYYLNKPTGDSGNREPNWFRVLMQYPALTWGLLTGIAMLALLALLGSRRKQRPIPKIGKPKNDSLDFVKTVGRLYYDRRDHTNLARKMAVYFLGHVRGQYKISTQVLDENFIRDLHYKSGYGMEGIRELVGFIGYLQSGSTVSESQLKGFHQQLEMFYQIT